MYSLTLLTLALACEKGSPLDSGPLTGPLDSGSEQPVDADGDGADADSDCDDADPEVNPQAQEICDGVDNDCDGLVDDEDESVDVESQGTFYVDKDGDGYGSQDSSYLACEPQPEGVAQAGDCDDAAAQDYPGAEELCDGRDNDCDGELPDAEADSDGDGLYDCEDSVQGTALEFTGDSYLELTGSEALHLSGPHTLEAWFKTDAAMDSGENAVLGKHYGGYYNSWFLGFNSYGSAPYAAQYYIGGPRMTGAVSLNDGQWHHLAGSFDGSTAILYVDGVEISRASYSPGATNSLPIIIGGHGRTGNYVGLLDEVRLWSVVRSPEQLQAKMSSALSGGEAGLVAYFDFNDRSGQIAADSSPNGWDAVLGSSETDSDSDPIWSDDAPF